MKFTSKWMELEKNNSEQANSDPEDKRGMYSPMCGC